MTTAVVDASVAVKWLLPEPLHEEALRLLDVESAFLSPERIVAEVGNAAWKKVQRGEIDNATAEHVASAICSARPGSRSSSSSPTARRRPARP